MVAVHEDPVLRAADGRIRVVRVITRLNVGGPAIHTVLLSAGLNPERFQTVLVTGHVADGEADMTYFAQAHGVNPVVIPELGRSIQPADDLVALWKLYRIIRHERPHVVHTHTAKAGALGRLAAVLACVPVVVHTYHGHVFSGYFGPMKARAFLAIERALARFTSRIVAISESQRHEIGGRYRVAPTQRVAVIPLGLDLSPFKAVPAVPPPDGLRSELGIGPSEIVIAIVGRLTAIKNHRLFLDAAARCLARGQGPSLRFLVVGGGELARDLCETARPLGDRVLFLGWRENLVPVYSACDIVALTSDNEGTPVALIEALAAGRAVVATDVGGVAEVLEGGRYGVLVPPRDPEAFAEAVLSLATNPDLRARLTLDARPSALGRFSTSALVGTVERLYSGLLDGRAAGSA